MTSQDIRDLVHASPFKPFRVHVADGKDLRVPNLDFALVMADYVVIAAELPGGMPGGINLVPYEHIARIERLSPKAHKTT